jgi:hypothetical protein
MSGSAKHNGKTFRRGDYFGLMMFNEPCEGGIIAVVKFLLP